MATWEALPKDLRVFISSFLSLVDLYHLQLSYPDQCLAKAFDSRILRIQPLYKAWVNAPPPALVSHGNDPKHREKDSRKLVQPIEFSQLTRATISNADLRSLGGISELSELCILDVSENQLEVIPDEILKCSKLRVLNCGKNALKAFPTILFKLPTLHTLLLNDNSLVNLPGDWASFSQMKRLGLYNCSLQGPLPHSFCELLETRSKYGYRTANLKHNSFNMNDVMDQFRQYPTLSSHVAI